MIPEKDLPRFNPYIAAEHFIGVVKSQLCLPVWLKELQFEMDEYLKSYILEGVSNGFKIVDDNSLIKSYSTPNYHSCLNNTVWPVINKTISDELDNQKYLIVDSQPHCVHALGVIEQKSKKRIITDCSRPRGESINNSMQTTCEKFKYKTIDQVVGMMSPQCFMSTVDIASAYRTIPVHPDNWTFQGVSWSFDGKNREFMVDTHLCFGLLCAPYIFTQVSNFIVNCMTRRGVHRILNYLDDYIIIGDTYEQCREGQQILMRLLISVGFSISWKKCASPCQIVEYLGIILDSTRMELRIPEAKMERLHKELLFFENKTRCTKKQLQRLCGIIAHVAKIVRGGRIFSRRLLDKLKGLKEGNPRIRLSNSFRLDMEWWLGFADQFNGRSMIPIENMRSQTWLATDSSQTGYGLVTNTDWQAGRFIKGNSETVNPMNGSDPHNHWFNVNLSEWPHEDININFLELIPVFLGLQRLTFRYKNVMITCFSDNTQTCAMINNGMSINKSCMNVIRQIFWMCVQSNCYIRAIHVPGVENTIPDLLSRWNVSQGLNALPSFLCCRTT